MACDAPNIVYRKLSWQGSVISYHTPAAAENQEAAYPEAAAQIQAEVRKAAVVLGVRNLEVVLAYIHPSAEQEILAVASCLQVHHSLPDLAVVELAVLLVAAEAVFGFVVSAEVAVRSCHLACRRRPHLALKVLAQALLGRAVAGGAGCWAGRCAFVLVLRAFVLLHHRGARLCRLSCMHIGPISPCS